MTDKLYGVSFAMRAKVALHVLVQELDGESVFLNLDGGCYFGLDRVGTDMWKALTTADSIEHAYEQLIAQYDVDAEILRRDFENLIEQLMAHGLLEIGSS